MKTTAYLLLASLMLQLTLSLKTNKVQFQDSKGNALSYSEVKIIDHNIKEYDYYVCDGNGSFKPDSLIPGSYAIINTNMGSKVVIPVEKLSDITIINTNSSNVLEYVLFDHKDSLIFGLTPSLSEVKKSEISVGKAMIKGKLIDKSNSEPLPFANIIIFKDGSQVAGTMTDMDGKYSISDLAPGKYEIHGSYVGYQPVKMVGVILNDGKITFADLKSSQGLDLEEFELVDYEIPLITKDMTSSGGTVTREEIHKMPGRSASTIAATVGGVVSTDDEVFIRGSRSSSTDDYIDGIRVRDSSEPSATSSTVTTSTVKSGLLTGAEVNDFGKWNQWISKVVDEFKPFESIWNFTPRVRYSVQVIGENKQSVVGAKVELLGSSDVIWSSISDNTGKAELFANCLGNNESPKKIVVSYKGESFDLDELNVFEKGVMSVQIPVLCERPNIVEGAFIVDATGSMSDEIGYLQADMTKLIENIQNIDHKAVVKTGSVFYRDSGDDYLLRTSDLSDELKQTDAFINLQSAGGGGDTPEAVDEALLKAVFDFSWSDEARTKIAFVILDAPPHSGSNQMNNMNKIAREAAKKGIRIVPVAGSGMSEEAEYLMRCLAITTNGTYVTLTNHSGIGGDHITPVTDEISVNLLTDVLNQVLYKFIYVPACGEQPIDVVKQYFSNIKVIDNVVVNPNWIDIQDDKITVFHTFSDTKSKNKNEENSLPLKREDLFEYYPNPSKGLLNVKLDKSAKQLFLFDMGGKLLQEFDVAHQENVQLDLNSYATGMYLLGMSVDDRMISGTVILQH